MHRRRWGIVVVAGLALIAVAIWLLNGEEATASTPYRLAEVERGDVEESVSSTGTLTAVQTVTIGTQVSGRVIELNADFNDRVREGDLLARIDPTLQQQQVRNSEASLERAQADLRRTQQEFDRNKTLYEQRVITESEFSEIEYRFAVARSTVTSAEINLEQARQNLAYTEIYAPIDGVVIERNAEVGQTVAASLSAPQLFLLANDLSAMEILASVDESDIGQIKAGQLARFTVQAYPDENFQGTVRQVRLQSSTTENVVNYTAVISVENADGRLLPGMTAVVDFIVQRAPDVFKVSNAALRFTPTEEMLASLDTAALAARRIAGGTAAAGEGDDAAMPEVEGGAQATPGASAPREAAARRAVRLGAGAAPAGSAGAGRQRMALIWYLQDGGPTVTRVRTGISDGVQTEIAGPDVVVGMQVIAGVNTAGAETRSETTNPFQQGRTGPGGGGVRVFGPGG